MLYPRCAYAVHICACRGLLLPFQLKISTCFDTLFQRQINFVCVTWHHIAHVAGILCFPNKNLKQSQLVIDKEGAQQALK